MAIKWIPGFGGISSIYCIYKFIKNKNMKTLHKINIVICVLSFALFAVSCLPKDETMGTAGLTTIEMTTPSSDGYYMYPISAVDTAQTFLVLDVRRNIPNSADLNTQTVVTLQIDGADTAMLNEYNLAHGTTFVPLPAGTYSFDPAIESGKIILTFAPGDIAKQINVTIPNSLLLDMANKYAFCFKATVTGTGTWSGSTNDILCIYVMPKNKYDGLYLLKGLHNRPPYDLYPYKTNMEMRTVGANSVAFYWPEPGINSYGHPIGTADGLSWYGPAVAPVVVFDPVTELVTNVYGTGAGGPPITLFTSGSGSNANKYDPATKTIYVSWNYNNNPARVFTDTLTYIGPR
jgi:hypothetical protein